MTNWDEIISSQGDEWAGILAPSAPPVVAVGGEYTSEYYQQGGRQYGVFEYIEPEERSFGGFVYNAFQDVATFLSPRNWIMATGAIAGATAQLLGADREWMEEVGAVTEMLPEMGANTPQSFGAIFIQAALQSPSFKEMGQAIIEPYVGGMEEFEEYAYEHPIQLALDLSIVASGARVAYRGALGALTKTARAAHITTAQSFSSAMRAGASRTELETMSQLQREAHAAWRGTADRLTRPDIVRGMPMVEPRAIVGYKVAPAVGAGIGSDVTRFFQRAPEQRFVSSLVDTWLAGASEATARQTLALRSSIQGLKPSMVSRFNGEFLALQQFHYNPERLIKAVSEGRILPQTERALKAWNGILAGRNNTLVQNGILTEQAIIRAAGVPTEVLGLASDLRTGRITTRTFRKRMSTWEGEMEAWGMAEVENPIRRPVDPITVRRDLKLMAEQPELFLLDDAGIPVSPAYYPHQFAKDLPQAAIREIAEAAMQHSTPGEFRLRAGIAFRSGHYEQDIITALTKNIRRINHHESLYNIVEETIQHYGSRKRLSWNPGDPIPDGYRVVYPEGFRVWNTTQFEEQVQRLAQEGISKKGLRPFEQRAFGELIDEFLGEGAKTIRKGEAELIPIEIAEHIKQHIAPSWPGIEVLTDIGGLTSFWRHFVLSFAPAWQAVNETSNAILTGIAGNLTRGGQLARQLKARGTRMPGMVGAQTILPEFGESFGYSARTQVWLKNRGRLGEAMLEFNRNLHNTGVMKAGRFGAQFNQIRDSFYKGLNVLTEIEREIRLAARTDVGLGIGPKTLTRAEVRQVARSGEKMLETMELILDGAGIRGQNHFLREMVARASETVYSWNALAPWQRQYLSKFIPFSGWQLFMNGLLMRLPVRYPGRAWLLKSMGKLGSDFVEDMFEAAGVDPSTIPEWDKSSLPLMVDDEGNVMVMRLTSFKLYDMLGVEDVTRTAFTHPLVKSIFEMSGTATFPEIGPMSGQPERWGSPDQPKPSPWDVILKNLFGRGYTLLNKIVHPYAQYGTGGLVSPEPVYIEGETIPIDWRSAISQYITGVSFREYTSYDMMSRAHKSTSDGVTGAFMTLENTLLKDDLSKDEVRSSAELYLQRAYQSVEQIEAMAEKTDNTRTAKLLRQERTSLINRIVRVEGMLQWIIAHPDSQIYPEMIHGEQWVNPRE